MTTSLNRIDRAVNMLVGVLVALAIVSCLLSVAVEKIGLAAEGVVRAARCMEPVGRAGR